LFDQWRTALMEDADLPAAHFDIAYSFMVMEHVANPTGFMSAVMRCLRPGGVYVFATPNRRHYFTRLASALHAIGLDEVVLRAAVGKKRVDEYHYPVQYRFNDERQINRAAKTLECLAPEFIYLEESGPIGYFPKPARFIYHALRWKRRLIQRRSALITMLCRIRKP
jgi:SAM-dependent methyltransferase